MLSFYLSIVLVFTFPELISEFILNLHYRKNGKISAQPHTSLYIQFLDRENNDKNNTFLLEKQICFTIGCASAEILPKKIIKRYKLTLHPLLNFVPCPRASIASTANMISLYDPYMIGLTLFHFTADCKEQRALGKIGPRSGDSSE